MKNILFVFGILFLTTITVNAQDSFRKMSIKKEAVTTIETAIISTSTEIYDAIYKDFENFFKKSTSQEAEEDEENTSLYDEIFKSFSFISQVEEEEQEDTENENIYLQLFIDIVKAL